MKTRQLIEEALDLVAFSLDFRLNAVEQRRRKNDRQTLECRKQADQVAALLHRSGVAVQAVPIVDTLKSIFKQERRSLFQDLGRPDSGDRSSHVSVSTSRDSSIRDVDCADGTDGEAAVGYSPTFLQDFPEDLPPLISIEQVGRRAPFFPPPHQASPGPIQIVDEREEQADTAFRRVMRDSSHRYEDRVEMMVALLQNKDGPQSFSFRDGSKLDNFDALLHKALQP